MKTLIIILIILSFLQTTIITLDLVLMVLILKAYILNDKYNLFLAFAFGLLISHLMFTPLGILSILYLLLVQIAHLANRSSIPHNPLAILPLMFILLSANELATALILHHSIELWPKVAIESVLSLPIYLWIRFWEEKFIVRSEIRLKIRA